MKKIQTFTLVSALLFANTSYGTKTQSISFTQATAGLVVAAVTAGLVGYFPKTLGVAAAMAAGGTVLGSFKERGALRDFSDAVLSRAKIFFDTVEAAVQKPMDAVAGTAQLAMLPNADVIVIYKIWVTKKNRIACLVVTHNSEKILHKKPFKAWEKSFYAKNSVKYTEIKVSQQDPRLQAVFQGQLSLKRGKTISIFVSKKLMTSDQATQLVAADGICASAFSAYLNIKKLLPKTLK